MTSSNNTSLNNYNGNLAISSSASAGSSAKMTPPNPRAESSSQEDSAFLMERMRLARKLRRMKRRLLLEVAEQRVPTSISFASEAFREEENDGSYPYESYLSMSASSMSSFQNGMGGSSSSVSMCSSALSTVTE